jgi:hypothetical protein
MAHLNHKWQKDETFKKEFVARGVWTTERHICTVCGCERDTTEGTVRGKPWVYHSYMRSKIVTSERPECIDWTDRETLNRID